MDDKTIKQLQAPFPTGDIEWRVQRAGKTNDGKVWAQVLAYVTNRAIQERLDTVVGPYKWWNEFQKAPDGGVMCGITITDGQKDVTKWDGAENTSVEAVKGGLSGAMKRAAVQWGIGRYLYNLDATFVSCSTSKPSDMTGWIRTVAKLNRDDKSPTPIYFKVPTLPSWALPKVDKP